MHKLMLTRSQAENLIDFFDAAFIANIREDAELDNMLYIVDMSNIYDQLLNIIAEANDE